MYRVTNCSQCTAEIQLPPDREPRGSELCPDCAEKHRQMVDEMAAAGLARKNRDVQVTTGIMQFNNTLDLVRREANARHWKVVTRTLASALRQAEQLRKLEEGTS